MADLNATFEAAVANSKNLSERPDNVTLLKIYALYKQATAASKVAFRSAMSLVLDGKVGKRTMSAKICCAVS